MVEKQRGTEKSTEGAALQDLRAVVKAELPEAQSQVGTLVNPSAEWIEDDAALASDIDAVTKPYELGEHAPSRAGQGVANPHNGTKRPPKSTL
jgi:hypothetical protein